jgi:2'-5' RNA ligase
VRLFVAVNFPAALRQRLWEAAAPARELQLPVRWVAAEAIHLTLKFLGETDATRAEELGAALDQAVTGVRAIPVTIEGFGAFPNATHPTVIWAGVHQEPTLELLQHGVERVFGLLGFPPEGRPFRPHVTLGRARRGPSRNAFSGLERVLESLVWSETVQIDAISLMQSVTGQSRGHGAVYEEVKHGRLS